MNTRNHYIEIVIALVVIWSFSMNAFSGPAARVDRENLSDIFLRMWHAEGSITLEKKKTSDNKVTSLFVRSAGKGSIELTMLIAYSRSITATTRKILNEEKTPLIFSVSALPLMSAEFNPENLTFVQNERSWSPQLSESAQDIFPLGKKGNFGGIINETQVHQGVILLPAWFDLTKPIIIKYKNFSKRTLLVHNR